MLLQPQPTQLRIALSSLKFRGQSGRLGNSGWLLGVIGVVLSLEGGDRTLQLAVDQQQIVSLVIGVGVE